MNYIGKASKTSRLSCAMPISGTGLSTRLSNLESSGFSRSNEDIYLNRKEIDMLLEVLEVLTPSEQLSRDLFIIGCFSGLRVSDYKQLSKEDLVEEDDTLMFEVRSNKTDTLLTIPVHPLIREVLSRHHGSPPPLQSEVLINRNMKRIGRLAERSSGTNKPHNWRTRQSTTQPKYE